MARAKLQKHPSAILGKVADPVEDPTTLDAAKIRRDGKMFCQLYDGVAVAAPQWGVSLRYFYIRSLDLIAVNPVILERSDETVEIQEGCLSFPDRYFDIERSERVVWRYQTPDGEEHERTSEFWEARIVQHEIDHLDGVCVIDHSA